MSDKEVIIIIGPPGAGKGTQADLISENLGFFHFETSKVVEEKFATIDLSDERMAAAKNDFDSGELVDPQLVTQWVTEKIEALAHDGHSVVMSSSPRTVFEADNLMPVFEKLYGKENIKVVHLNLTKEESIKRNSTRRICKMHRHPIPNFDEYKDITVCPKDGSEILSRSIDNTETIGVRYEVYLRRTHPVFSALKDKGYEIIEIEGEQSIDKVYADILDGLETHEGNAALSE